MKPRPARAKTPRARKEPNTDRGLNERVTREKPDRESPPNSKKRRVHLCSCSRVRRARTYRERRWLQKKHSSFKLPGSAVFQFLNWTGMWHLREKEENLPNAVTVLLRCAFANKPRAAPPFPNS
jgi:hypothetical protein